MTAKLMVFDKVYQRVRVGACIEGGAWLMMAGRAPNTTTQGHHSSHHHHSHKRSLCRVHHSLKRCNLTHDRPAPYLLPLPQPSLPSLCMPPCSSCLTLSPIPSLCPFFFTLRHFPSISSSTSSILTPSVPFSSFAKLFFCFTLPGHSSLPPSLSRTLSFHFHPRSQIPSPLFTILPLFISLIFANQHETVE